MRHPDSGLVVVDTSVVVKWYVPEPWSEQAVALLAHADRLIAPELLVPEFGNTVWKKVRRRELAPREANQIVQTFTSAPPVTVYSSLPLLNSALALALRLGQTVYDCLYLALTVAVNGRFVTADKRLVTGVARDPLRHVVVHLSEVAARLSLGGD